MGLILIYRANRFINFAYGSMGSFVGVLAIGLYLEKGVPFFLALAVGVAIGVATGAVVDLIVRRFRTSSRLVLTVASIGIGSDAGRASSCSSPRRPSTSSPSPAASRSRSTCRFNMDVKTFTGDEILIMLVDPAGAGRAWRGSCCAPTSASPCGPRPRTPTGPCSSASRSGGCRRSCGWSPAAWPPSPSCSRRRSPGSKPGAASSGTDRAAPGPRRRRGRPHGVAARRLRGRASASGSWSRSWAGTPAAPPPSRTPSSSS